MGEPWPRALPGLQALATPVDTPADDALALCAALLDSADLNAGARALAATLAARCGLDRVSVGWFEDGRTRLIACSGVEVDHLGAEDADALRGAMDEALDQARSLRFPGDTPDALVLEQRLLQARCGGAVATVPLGVAGQRLAAVCLERRAGMGVIAAPFTAPELQRIESLLALSAPALRWLHAGTEPAWRRLWRDLRQGWSAMRRSSGRTKRRWLLGAALLAGFGLCVPLPDSVGGRARVEGAEQRVLAAPTDGFIKTVHVRPGDQVLAGAPLLDLLEADLRLEHERWASQLAQHENAYAAAMAKSDRVASATSLSRMSEAQAQMALVDEQLSRGRLVAPFDGQVIQGDLSQSIGAPVRQGDALLTLATTGRQRIIVEVSEVDIARIAKGQPGRLALSSLPWEHEDIVVERIAPLAKAVGGNNVFEVEARLLQPRDAVRPGLLGRAELESGHAPLLWSWLRHSALRLRVALWSWWA